MKLIEEDNPFMRLKMDVGWVGISLEESDSLRDESAATQIKYSIKDCRGAFNFQQNRIARKEKKKNAAIKLAGHISHMHVACGAVKGTLE